jgi:hypothetical protein
VIELVPANARTLRSLLVPSADEVRVAVLNAVVKTVMAVGFGYLVARYAAPTTGPQASCDDARPAVPALVIEREPTPAQSHPPLIEGAPVPTTPPPILGKVSGPPPRLITPDDAAADGDPEPAPGDEGEPGRRGP